MNSGHDHHAEPGEHDSDHDDQHELALIGYLAGELPPDQRDQVDEHLIECDHCWQDVQLARTGQALARGAAETAPEAVRARLGADPSDPSESRRQARTRVPGRRDLLTRRVLTGVAALSLVTATFLTGVEVARRTTAVARPAALTATSSTPTRPSATTRSAPSATAPAILTAAVAGFERSQLPGTAIPAAPPPDLLTLGLHVMGAGTGSLEGQEVTAYCYADPETGEQIFVYVSPTPFHAIDLPTGSTTGTRTIDHLTVYADTGHPMLVLGTDPHLVVTVGTRLT